MVVRFASTGRRSGRSPTNRSSCSRTSPPRPSSPSRTRGCSTNCASAPTTYRVAGAADGHRRRAQGHQPSPGELEPVFEAMLENATRICEARFGLVPAHDGGAFRTGAMHRRTAAIRPAIAAAWTIASGPGPLHPLARVVAAKQVHPYSDVAEDPAYKLREPAAVRLVELAGARSLIGVPMLKESELIGVIVIYRAEVRPFTDKQIAAGARPSPPRP